MEYVCQLEVNSAVAMIVILVQLLTSNSIATTAAIRALVCLCMVLELLGISLAICLSQAHHMHARDNHHSNAQPPLQHASRVPTALILAGIVGLGVALVAETFGTSLGTALTMGGFLIFGIGLCVSLLVCGLRVLVRARAGLYVC